MTRALVVVESSFGNTRQVARAIAEGLGNARVVDVAEAPTRIPDDVELVVVGGPTKAFGMSRASTPADAVKQGGADGAGIREWIAMLGSGSGCQVATFDTKVRLARHWPGSAAKGAAKALDARGFAALDKPHTFYVTGTSGPLEQGELQRARTWGAELASRTGEEEATSPRRRRI